MPSAILLDAGPLGMISNPRVRPEIASWLKEHVRRGTSVFIPEIADYEIRRNLILENSTSGLRRLDDLKRNLGYLPITTDVFLIAAEYWASLRKSGKPTAHEKALDCDVILAAQASLLARSGYAVVVATSNVKHIDRLVPAMLWDSIKP